MKFCMSFSLLFLLQCLFYISEGSVQLDQDMQAQIDCISEELDPSDKYGGLTCEERKDANQCGEDFMIYGGFCLKTCGFCSEYVLESASLNVEIGVEAARSSGSVFQGVKQDQGEKETSVTKSSAFFGVLDTTDDVDEVRMVHPYTRTLRGCQCPDSWRYNGTTYKGCANPNRSFLGGWCPVDPNTCFTNPVMRQNDVLEVMMDYRQAGQIVVPLGGDREYWIDGCHCCPPALCRGVLVACIMKV
eukprot:TRINITY_DN12253_c0_g1_i8.p1 TRINITY_DN12253_c0_g1~~TRINITY_DN12253_c0_g1_i8.p1  ORF type:complete len:245 (-),score=24.16 TRINITY_DN12253_c0_g1_i8:1032-1766(-)